MTTLTWQASLLDGDPGGGPQPDPGFSGLRRLELGAGAWVDHVPGWVAQPRLTDRLALGALPAGLEVLDEVAGHLTQRYRVVFTSVGANLYRDGRDSVAWHGDRGHRERLTATIATVSLGHPRTFRLRPREGGRSLGLVLGRGDLLVMGGTCQRTFAHAVPKVASAGTRISLGFRHADPPQRL